MAFRSNDARLTSDPATASSRIFIGNLGIKDLNKSQLTDKFSKYGTVTACSLNRGFAFVQFDTDNSAVEAIKQENGTIFCGKKIEVKPARVPNKTGNTSASSVDLGRPADNGRPEVIRDRSPLDDRRDWRDRERFEGFPGSGGPGDRLWPKEHGPIDVGPMERGPMDHDMDIDRRTLDTERGPLDRDRGQLDRDRRSIDRGRGPIDMPMDRDAAPLDRGPIDRGPLDRGPIDRGPLDRGRMDRGLDRDRGPADRRQMDRDRGLLDRGPGERDRGPMDRGLMDRERGPLDWGSMDRDRGPMDRGIADRGPLDRSLMDRDRLPMDRDRGHLDRERGPLDRGPMDYSDRGGFYGSDRNGKFPPLDSYRGGPGGFRPGMVDPPRVGSLDYPSPAANIAPADRTNDCEIIVVNKSNREYAEYIERRLKQLGLSVDILFPNEVVPIPRVLANISSRGSLYAIVILQQNEDHRSLTLNILHGLPEEHRNMPLEAAVSLISRNFEQYIRGEKTSTSSVPAPVSVGGALPTKDRHPEPIQVLLNLLSDNRQLTVLQYEKVLHYIENRRQQQIKVELGDAKDLSPSRDSGTQQVELQHRILNILNSSAPPPTIAPPMAPQLPSPWQQPEQPKTVPPLLNDPSVQKALNSIIQERDLLKKISGSGNQQHNKMGRF